MLKKSLIGIFFSATLANASNGFASEFSHFAGGLLMVWLIAYIIIKFLPNYKKRSILIAFFVSLAYVSVDQSIDYLKDGAFFNQLLDFTVHLFGSILAVFVAHTMMKRD